MGILSLGECLNVSDAVCNNIGLFAYGRMSLGLSRLLRENQAFHTALMNELTNQGNDEWIDQSRHLYIV